MKFYTFLSHPFYGSFSGLTLELAFQHIILNPQLQFIYTQTLVERIT